MAIRRWDAVAIGQRSIQEWNEKARLGDDGHGGPPACGCFAPAVHAAVAMLFAADFATGSMIALEVCGPWEYRCWEVFSAAAKVV